MATTEKFLSGFFVTLCVIGLTYQISLILQIYLSFKTVTVVLITLPTLDRPPDASICLRYSHLFDFERYNLEHPSARLNISSLELQEAVTVKQIFDYTPSTGNLFPRCFIRYPGDFKVTKIDPEQCDEKIHVVKYITQAFMCYRLNIVLTGYMNRKYDYAQVTRSLEYPGSIYNVKLNITAGLMKMALHGWRSQPLYSIMFCPYLSLKFDGKVTNEMFSLTGSSIKIVSLPPPYDTRCRDYSPHYSSQTKCEFACIRNLTMLKLDKTSYEIFEMEATLEKKIVSVSDLYNETTAKTLTEISTACNEKCRYSDCVNEFTLTRVMRSPVLDVRYNYIFVEMSREPSLQITFKAVMALLDFVIYILSSAGTWLGISVFTLNPARWLNRASRFKRQRCTVAPPRVIWAARVPT
ncbi:hypothetical protein HDE_14075 [Halotydeus destructor]|nr:hypothetical protein HDE_14075 [Halotydeus destructor]